MGLYYFARADQMEDYKFTDDVTIVQAITKKSAMKKFSRLYADVEMDEVYRVRFGTRVRVLTDY